MAHAQLTPTNLRMTPEDVRRRHREDGDRLAQVFEIVRACTMRALSARPSIEETTTVWETSDGTRVQTIGRRVVREGWLAYDEAEMRRNSTEDALVSSEGARVVTCEELQGSPGVPLASLLQAMASLGIGRPSTHASTIERLIERRYVVFTDGRIRLTDEGRELFLSLMRSIPLIADVSFTSRIESALDEIASAESDEEAERRSLAFLRETWTLLNSKGYYVAQAVQDMGGVTLVSTTKTRSADHLIPRDHPLRRELELFERLVFEKRAILDDVRQATGRKVDVKKVFALMHVGNLLGAHEGRELSELLEFDVRARWFVDYPHDRSAWPASLIVPVIDMLRDKMPNE